MGKYRFLRFPDWKFKAVTFSYDDGVKDDIRLAETLDRYGLKGTFNINNFASDTKLTPEDVERYILASGHEVAIHGKQHLASGAASPLDCIQDALFGRQELEQSLGRIIRGMAYPDSGIRNFANGNTYENVKASLTSLGIVYARTLGGDNDSFKLPTDWHAWMPTAHHANPDIMKYVNSFVAIKEENFRYASGRWPRLCYIWGHSFEFSRNNNWELLDEMCEALSGQDDTWYATNMEIYEYVTAYNSLVTSVDGSMIYNPTLKTIWFMFDNKNYVIAPGETLKI